jgi:hypothetical protein
MHHENSFPAIPIILFVVIAIGVAVLSWLQQKKRRAAWLPFAAGLGCQFSPGDPFGIPGASPHSFFNQGHSQRAYNVMCGVYKSRPLRCFDYRYTIGSGKNSHTYTLTCVMLEAPIPFPPLVVRPEGFLDHLEHVVGIEDIQFESAEFNRKFYVKCQDRKFAYDVIHQAAMAYLLQHTPLCIEGNGTAVLFHLNVNRGLLPLPAGVTELLDESSGFLDLLPDYLLHGRGAPSIVKEPSPPAPN